MLASRSWVAGRQAGGQAGRQAEPASSPCNFGADAARALDRLSAHARVARGAVAAVATEEKPLGGVA